MRPIVNLSNFGSVHCGCEGRFLSGSPCRSQSRRNRMTLVVVLLFVFAASASQPHAGVSFHLPFQCLCVLPYAKQYGLRPLLSNLWGWCHRPSCHACRRPWIWGLGVPLASCPQRMSFGKRPSSMRSTWPNQRRRLWLSSEYMLTRSNMSLYGDTVLPGDAKDTLEAPHVEGVEATLLAHVCGSRFAALEESAQHTGLIDPHLGVLSEHLSIPYYFDQLCLRDCGFSDPLFISVSSERLLEMFDPR